jgi:hypothetical protein
VAVESGSTAEREIKVINYSRPCSRSPFLLGTQSRAPVKSCDDVSVGEHEKPNAGLLNCAAVGVVQAAGKLPLARYGGYADVDP